MDGRAGGLQLRRALAVLVAFVLAAGPTWAAVGCTIYVDSVGGSNTSPYDTWAKAATTLNSGLGAWGTTDIVCVEDNHSESNSGNLTLSGTGDSAGAPIPVYSVTSADDSYSPNSSAAQITTTSGGDIIFGSSFKVFGLYLLSADDILAPAADDVFSCRDCYFEMNSSNAALNMGGADKDNIYIYGGTVNFSHANGGKLSSNRDFLVMEGVTFAGGVWTTGLFVGAGSNPNGYILRGCDLSAYSSETLVDASGASGSGMFVHLIGSLLPATVTLDDGGYSVDGQYLYLSGTDDATGNESFRTELHGFRGSVTTDTTVYQNAGLAFTEGSTNASVKFAPDANVSEWEPLCSWPVSEWIDSTGSKTWTTEVVENFTTALTDAEVWQEIFYLGTTSSPEWTLDLGQTIGGTTNLAAGTGLANWTAEPSGSRSVKLTTTATVNKAGIYQIRWCVGAYEAGKVVHIDADPTVS